MLTAHGPAARPLGGGTDLLVGLRHGDISPALVVDLKGIEELGPPIRDDDDHITIGAGAVMTDLEEDARIGELFPSVVEAARVVGSVQIRNRATVAGNICTASPAADTPPALMALDAQVTFTGPNGQRTMPLADFVVGYRQTALGPGDLVTAIRIPIPRRRSGSAFIKLGVRRALEISIACVATRVDLADDGSIAGVGIGLGSVAPTTVRAPEAEQQLIGLRPGSDEFTAAGAAALAACRPIDDVRASADYREAMVPVLVARALATAAARAA